MPGFGSAPPHPPPQLYRGQRPLSLARGCCLPRSAGAGHRAMSHRPRGRDTHRREPKPQSSAPAPGEGSKAPSPTLARAEAQAALGLPPHGKTPEPNRLMEGDSVTPGARPAGGNKRTSGDLPVGDASQEKRNSARE